MTDQQKLTYERIYDYLKGQGGFISVTELASYIGVPERAMRNDGTTPGILELASLYVLSMYGFTIIRSMNPAGIKMTNNVEEIRAVVKQWAAFRDSIDRQVKRYDGDIAYFERTAAERKQLSLQLEVG